MNGAPMNTQKQKNKVKKSVHQKKPSNHINIGDDLVVQNEDQALQGKETLDFSEGHKKQGEDLQKAIRNVNIWKSSHWQVNVFLDKIT